MNHFYIVANSHKEGIRETSERMKAYLESRGASCIIGPAQEERERGDFRYTDPSLVPEDTDCVLVIGGDGTLIQAARDLLDRDIPLLGINQGTLGYLAEVDAAGVEEKLDCLIEGGYHIEHRMMLRGTMVSGGRAGLTDYALNDIVISRGRSLKVNYYSIYVNGELLNQYTADGIIVSTPTGSTAYNLSAGGPVVDPKAAMMVITPISAHTLQNRSIVLSADSHITIAIDTVSDKKVEPCVAFYDGNERGQLGYRDRMEIDQARFTTKLVRVGKAGFLEILRRKMADR